jgi:hypothetical protein
VQKPRIASTIDDASGNPVDSDGDGNPGVTIPTVLLGTADGARDEPEGVHLPGRSGDGAAAGDALRGLVA